MLTKVEKLNHVARQVIALVASVNLAREIKRARHLALLSFADAN